MTIKNGSCTVSASYSEYQEGCPHRNGWFIYVWFLIFCKKIYVCSDCGKPIEVKR